MTLTLNLTQEQEARLRVEAERSGLTLPEYIVRRLLGDPPDVLLDEKARLAAIDAAFGAFADVPFSSEDLMREKREEVEREEARFGERFR